MNKQKTQSKIIVVLTSVVLLLVALSATLTFAYFTSTASLSNTTMKFGNLSLTLRNAADTADLGENLPVAMATADSSHAITNLMPGCVFQPEGKIKVTSSIASYVRLKIVIAVSGGSGASATSANLLSYMNDSYLGTGSYKFTNDGLGAGGDSGWYYAAIPATITATEILDLSHLVITLNQNTIGNDWQNATATITLTVQAIQADHLMSNAISAEALSAKGETNPTAVANNDIVTASADSTSTALTAGEVLRISNAKAWSVDLTTGVPTT